MERGGTDGAVGRRPDGSALRLASRGTATAAQRDVVLGEDAVHEPVGTARLLGESADAGALAVLLRQLASELGAVGTRDPGALLDSVGH